MILLILKSKSNLLDIKKDDMDFDIKMKSK